MDIRETIHRRAMERSGNRSDPEYQEAHREAAMDVLIEVIEAQGRKIAALENKRDATGGQAHDQQR